MIEKGVFFSEEGLGGNLCSIFGIDLRDFEGTERVNHP